MSRLVGIALAVAACRPPATPVVTSVTPGCRVAHHSRDPRERADTIRVVLPGGATVTPQYFPLRDSDADRLVFAQLYETLVRRDCAGVLMPGLAERWTPVADSAWRLKLRSDARFSDGTPATASVVAAALTAVAPDWRVTAQGEHDLIVRASGERLPAALAEGRFAIGKAGGPGGWPGTTLGTIMPTERGVTLTRGDAVLIFTWPVAADARDLLEGGADAVLSDQPPALEYVATRPAFDAIPMPWSRTYVLAVPPGGNAAIARGAAAWRDAVRGDAREAVGPFWWATAKCAGLTEPVPSTSSPTRVLYAQGDERARGLAERVVARGVARAAPVGEAELRGALARRTEYGIIPLPRSADAGCPTLLSRGLAGRPPTDLIPLIDTRFQLLIRSGRFGVALDGDGIPRFDP